MRHAPLDRRSARIADEAQATQYPVIIEQHRQDDRVAGHAGADLALSVQWVVDRAADILVLIVEPGGDFVPAGVLGAALAELQPAVDFLTRRAAIAAAGQFAKSIERHRR